MKKIIKNQNGVTLIETIVATALISILLVTIIGSLLFGQKVIFFSDEKNNKAAEAQEIIDDIMTQLSGGIIPEEIIISEVRNTGTAFNDDQKIEFPKQYYIMSVVNSDGKKIGYNIYVRIYYNNGNDQINFTSFAELKGEWV
jgi:prepilin-type N-terminal cleavage/methylation domain-containing protein